MCLAHCGSTESISDLIQEEVSHWCPAATPREGASLNYEAKPTASGGGTGQMPTPALNVQVANTVSRRCRPLSQAPKHTRPLLFSRDIHDGNTVVIRMHGHVCHQSLGVGLKGLRVDRVVDRLPLESLGFSMQHVAALVQLLSASKPTDKKAKMPNVNR
jgi:hypothetical protein